MQILVAADHRGFNHKQSLVAFLVSEQLGDVSDLGAENYNEHDDYTEYTRRVCEQISVKQSARGILLCGTGQGMAMAANKYSGVRAALAWDLEQVILARQKNDANVLVLPSESLTEEEVFAMAKTFIQTAFSGEERHIRRIADLATLDKRVQ